MSVTDELRAELTKRGVKWSNRDGLNDYKTVWHHAHTSYLLIESLFYSDTTILKVRKPTVAQAIAATLGESMTDTEKAALERRIDELCQEVERLHADQAHWELGNCPSCPNIADLQEALEQNAKLRELAAKMAEALEIYSEWCDPACCQPMCVAVFKCHSEDDCEIRCPAWARLRELGVVK